MSDTTSAGGYPAISQMRTLAVRITDDLRAQLGVITQLNDRSVTEEIRIALDAGVVTSRSDPKALARAGTVRADIEQEVKTKHSAIEAIFGGKPSTGVTRSKAKPQADTWLAQAVVPGIEHSACSRGATAAQLLR